MDGRRKQTPKRRVASNSRNRSVNNKRSMPSKMRALILAVAAIIVIALVVMIAAGAFGGKSEKKPAVEEETTVIETTIAESTEETVSETTVESATETAEETAEETQEATGDERVVYLTFNSTPGDGTAQLLDVLDKNGIKATFFVSCDESNVSIVKDIAERGHSVGVMLETVAEDAETFKHDLNTARQMIFLETGELSEVFRFNGGSRSGVASNIISECKAYLDELGMVYYDWNIESADTESDNAENIVWSVVSQIDENTFKTNVVLMHDGNDNEILASALDQIIPDLKEKGFGFDKLTNETPEMTFDLEV